MILAFSLQAGLQSNPVRGQTADQQPYFLVSQTPLVLLSANDAEIGSRFGPRPLSSTQDSISVIRLFPDSPPKAATVYGTVPSSIIGPPRMAIVRSGRYGVVANNPMTLAQLFGDESLPDNPTGLVSVIDLESPNLEVTDTFELDGLPQMVAAHPDDDRFLINTFDALNMFRISEGSVVEVASIATDVPINAFDISADGNVVLASGLPDSIHVFRITGDSIQYQVQVGVEESGPRPEDPFTVRISPSGDRAIVLNGNGSPYKGYSDDALLIDMTMTPPQVVSSIPDIADGLEGLVIHPDGHMAVIGCLDDHLAVVDLTLEDPRVVYYLDLDGLAFPEGLEFSPDGSKLFVGLTGQNHIAVYDVDGYGLTESPLVLRTGHSPTSLAVSRFGE